MVVVPVPLWFKGKFYASYNSCFEPVARAFMIVGSPPAAASGRCRNGGSCLVIVVMWFEDCKSSCGWRS